MKTRVSLRYFVNDCRSIFETTFGHRNDDGIKNGATNQKRKKTRVFLDKF